MFTSRFHSRREFRSLMKNLMHLISTLGLNSIIFQSTNVDSSQIMRPLHKLDRFHWVYLYYIQCRKKIFRPAYSLRLDFAQRRRKCDKTPTNFNSEKVVGVQMDSVWNETKVMIGKWEGQTETNRQKNFKEKQYFFFWYLHCSFPFFYACNLCFHSLVPRHLYSLYSS